jgi:hypothetical protein
MSVFEDMYKDGMTEEEVGHRIRKNSVSHFKKRTFGPLFSARLRKW